MMQHVRHLGNTYDEGSDMSRINLYDAVSDISMEHL